MDSGVSGQPAIRRFTCDEAIRMVEEGIVGEDEHYELLDGKFVDSDPTTGENRHKSAIHAVGCVQVYWLVDLVARKLEVRTTPVNGAYQVTRILKESDVVELPESSERWIVRDLFL